MEPTDESIGHIAVRELADPAYDAIIAAAEKHYGGAKKVPETRFETEDISAIAADLNGALDSIAVKEGVDLLLIDHALGVRGLDFGKTAFANVVVRENTDDWMNRVEADYKAALEGRHGIGSKQGRSIGE